LQIVEVLLEHGAHIDARNASSERPIDLLKLIPDCKINSLQFTTLKCLAARVIASHNLPFKNEVPSMLEGFIDAH
jgi:Fem-1 family protein b